ncbi:MAG TPA: LysR family transcriptional regulator [Candidatus Dormibacteraeota bacterium]|nr:LysR family transcriptional regulator [Candidatus Dormibacteraeota bacterium]
MDLASLETFLAVVRAGSFSRAAESLHRTQPAVSIALRKLEEDLGQRLLVRGSRELKLTDAGRLLVDSAERMLNLREELRRSIDDLKHLRRGQLNLGANESSVHAVLPALAQYRRRFPDVPIAVHRTFSRDVPRHVLNYRLDLGVISFVAQEESLTSVEFFRDELVLVVYPGHRFARRRRVEITELAEDTFIAHIVESPYRWQVIQLFAGHRAPLRRDIELPTIDSIKRFVQMEMGVAIVPRTCVRLELERGALVALNVPQLRITRNLYLIHRNDHPLPQAARAFIDLLKGKNADGAPARSPSPKRPAADSRPEA